VQSSIWDALQDLVVSNSLQTLQDDTVETLVICSILAHSFNVMRKYVFWTEYFKSSDYFTIL